MSALSGVVVGDPDCQDFTNQLQWLIAQRAQQGAGREGDYSYIILLRNGVRTSNSWNRV
jgi:hypothetical protein